MGHLLDRGCSLDREHLLDRGHLYVLDRVCLLNRGHLLDGGIFMYYTGGVY